MRKIWLADDDADDQSFFQQSLLNISENISLVITNDGEDLLNALEADTSAKPDMIFLDVNMPKLNGIETLKKLKENIRFSHFPVVVLTTSNNSELIDEMYRNGADYYMIKPVSFRVLQKLIYKVLLHPIIGQRKPTKESFVLRGDLDAA